jgi:DNA-binding LacI/PurR family transcriptional regulator
VFYGFVRARGYEIAQVLRLLELGVEGLMLIGNDHSWEVDKALRRTGVVHNNWAYEPWLRRPKIDFSSREAANAIVDHLLALGCRRIGMIAGITAGNDRSRIRLEAVRHRRDRRSGRSRAASAKNSMLIGHDRTPTCLPVLGPRGWVQRGNRLARLSSHANLKGRLDQW